MRGLNLRTKDIRYGGQPWQTLGLFILLGIGFASQEISAQQDAQYTQYMYNTLSINPAYAGSRDVFSIVGLYRDQWVGLSGTPRTVTFSLHSPVGKNVGLGFNVVRDDVFITSETYADFDFSYTLNLSKKSKLALGVKGGVHLLDINSTKLVTGPFNIGDPDSEINIDSKFSPQVGFGAYFYTPRFYVGASVPNFIETEHFETSDNSNNSLTTAKERINFYFISGYTLPLTREIQFKPAILTKYVEGAPLQVDFSGSFLVSQRFSFGAAYRWDAAVSFMAGFQLTNQILVGVAYDRATTDLVQYNNGTYEALLRFELFDSANRLVSPRFF